MLVNPKNKAMKKLDANQMENLAGGICLEGPGSAGCNNRCEATLIAFIASGGRYPGPICVV